MTPRLKTIIFLVSIPIIIYSVVILTIQYITPHERLSPFFGLILSYLVIAAIYIYFIKTKEEEKDLWHIYSKLYFLLIRFTGYSFLIVGILGIISLLSGHTNVPSLGEKIAALLMLIFSILIGIGILIAKGYKPEEDSSHNDKKNEKANESKQYSQLGSIYKDKK